LLAYPNDPFGYLDFFVLWPLRIFKHSFSSNAMNFINVDLSSGVFILSMGIWFSFCHSDVLTANAVADWDSDLEDPGVDIDRSSHHMPRSCKTAD